MSALVTFLVEHASDLVLAFTVLLGLGALAVAASRSILARHRVAELTFAASLVAIALLLLPLPRPAAEWLGTRGGPAEPEDLVSATERPADDREGAPAPAVEPTFGPWIPFDALGLPLERAQLPANAHADPSTNPPTRGDRSDAGLVAGGRRETGESAATGPGRGTRPAGALDLARGEGARPGSRAAAPLLTDRVLAGLFLAAAAAFALHLALAVLLVRRTLRAARPAPTWIDDLAQESGSRAVKVLVSARAARPFCCGLLRGTVVLPESLARPELTARVEAVLHHERAHLAQRHPRARFVAALGAPFLYWNPLYWWLVRDLRRTAELLADDMAAARHGKRRYVAELLELATQTRRALVPQAARLDVLGPRKDFQKRMETLLMRQSRLATRSTGSHVLARSACALVVLGSVSLAWGHAPAQDADPNTVQDPVVDDFRVKRAVEDAADEYFLPARDTQDRADVADACDAADPVVVSGYFVAAGDHQDRADAQPTAPGDARNVIADLADFVADASVPGANSQDGSPDPFTADGFVGRANPLSAPDDRGMSVELIFEADSPHALGAYLIYCAGKDFSIGPLDLERTSRGSHRGTLTLTGMTQKGLQEFMSSDHAGVRITFARFENVAVTLPLASDPEPTPARGDALAELARLSAQLDALTQRLDQLEGRTTNPFAGALLADDFTDAVAPGIQAVVSQVFESNGQTLVMLSRGNLAGVSTGDKFEIYKGNSYKGRVRVIDTSKEYSIGTIETEAKGRKIQTGDTATTRL